MFNEDPLPFFDREQGFRLREEINLLVHACHSILPILHPSYFFLSFFFSSFSFSVFTYFCCDSFLEVAIIVFVIVIRTVIPSAVHNKALFYSAHRDQILLF